MPYARVNDPEKLRRLMGAVLMITADVELADLLDGALVTDVVAAALGVRDHPGRALTDVLVDFLIERRALVVLDNCEQLIDDAAKLAETLLRACRNGDEIAAQCAYRIT